jgi:hypothetical protein
MVHNNHEACNHRLLRDRRRWPRSLWIDGSSAAYRATNVLASRSNGGAGCLSNPRADDLAKRRADGLPDSTGNSVPNGHANANTNTDPVANGQRSGRVE